MTRWSIVVSDETDKALRMFLAQAGGRKGDLSHFVEAAVQSRLFALTVERIKDRNAEFPQAELLDLIEEAMVDSRASRS